MDFWLRLIAACNGLSIPPLRLGGSLSHRAALPRVAERPGRAGCAVGRSGVAGKRGPAVRHAQRRAPGLWRWQPGHSTLCSRDAAQVAARAARRVPRGLCDGPGRRHFPRAACGSDGTRARLGQGLRRLCSVERAARGRSRRADPGEHRRDAPQAVAQLLWHGSPVPHGRAIQRCARLGRSAPSAPESTRTRTARTPR